MRQLTDPRQGRKIRRPGRPRRRLAVCLGALLILSNCTIVIVSGPSTVSVGETVTYVLDVGSNSNGLDVTLFVIADVPAGWDLVSSSFDGTIDGVPTSGNGTVVASTVCDYLTGDILPGFQRLHIAAGPFPAATSSDTGSVTLEFDVDSQPSGEFKVFFRFAASGSPAGDCSSPAVRTINSEGIGFLSFIEALFDGVGGVDGLDGAIAVTVSPDGLNAYAGSAGDHALTVFSRDQATGELTFIEALFDGVGGVDGLLATSAVTVSPDGLHVYTASLGDDALAAFSRDTITGELTFIEAVFDGVGGNAVTVSPDGLHVYAASRDADALTLFSRDQLTGELTFIEALFDGVDGVDGLDGANAVTVSADGLFVYTASGVDNALAVFGRNTTTGELTFLQAVFDGVGGVDGLAGARSVAITADGKHLYSAAIGSPASIGVFTRDMTTGELTFVEVQAHGSGGVFGLELSRSVAVGAGGNQVFATGDNSVVVFARNPASGGLTFIEAQFQDDPPNQGLEGTVALTASVGGQHLYAASDYALAAFRISPIFADGFESGDTSAWSSSVP